MAAEQGVDPTSNCQQLASISGHKRAVSWGQLAVCRRGHGGRAALWAGEAVGGRASLYHPTRGSPFPCALQWGQGVVGSPFFGVSYRRGELLP